jgi:hypothetical protein
VKWLKEHIHTVLLIFWICMIVPVILWRESIVLVLLMSWYANVEASAAAREARKNG